MDTGPSGILIQKAKLIGPGKINGQLFDLGAYPGLVYIAEGKTKVQGQIFELDQVVDTLSFLDAYEGFDPHHPQQGEYIRKICPVSNELGEIYYCQTYIYQGDLNGKILIPSGDYSAFVRSNIPHQQFINRTKL